MHDIVAGGVECKKSHQEAAHRKTIPFEAGFYAVCGRSQLVTPLALYKSGARKYERPRLFGWRDAGPGSCSMMSAEP
jgi:hypothetical protein